MLILLKNNKFIRGTATFRATNFISKTFQT